MRILFASPYCLADPSSGASLSCRTILERFAAKGHECVAVGATVFDQPAFATPGDFLERVGAKRLSLGDEEIWRVDGKRIRHFLVPVQAQRRKLMLAREENTYYKLMKFVVTKLPPDVVLTYGGQVSDLASYRWLKDQDVPIVFYLANGNYHGLEAFQDAAAVITDSLATARLYKERLGLDVTPVGKFVPSFAPGPDDRREFCTFINPGLEKGVALFVEIARECLRRELAAKFLVVESRAKLSWRLDALGIKAEDLPNVKCVPLQPNMRAVWSQTKILLHPSFWHESGSRTILEALSAHVPSLATRSGGIEQMIGDSGRLFPVPVQDKSEHADTPSPEVVKTWVDCLEKWLTDEEAFAAERERARRAWETHRYCNVTTALESVFHRVIAPKANGAEGLEESVGSATAVT